MNPELQPLQSFETTFMLVIGLVCGTVPLAAIFIAVFCFMKRREKGKPLRYLDNKYGNSAPRVKNTDTLPSQYDSQKVSLNASIRSSSIHPYIYIHQSIHPLVYLIIQFSIVHYQINLSFPLVSHSIHHSSSHTTFIHSSSSLLLMPSTK